MFSIIQRLSSQRSHSPVGVAQLWIVRRHHTLDMSITIYISLLDEGTDVWRPVSAERVSGEIYRITGTPPDDTETWEFVRTATNGMTKRHPLENQHRSGFTLLTCPVPKERSVHLSFQIG